MSATCEHLDFDEYFEKCHDCGQTLEQIHEAECVPTSAGFDAKVDEAPTCGRCGLQPHAPITNPARAFQHPAPAPEGRIRP